MGLNTLKRHSEQPSGITFIRFLCPFVPSGLLVSMCLRCRPGHCGRSCRYGWYLHSVMLWPALAGLLCFVWTAGAASLKRVIMEMFAQASLFLLSYSKPNITLNKSTQHSLAEIPLPLGGNGHLVNGLESCICSGDLEEHVFWVRRVLKRPARSVWDLKATANYYQGQMRMKCEKNTLLSQYYKMTLFLCFDSCWAFRGQRSSSTFFFSNCISINVSTDKSILISVIQCFFILDYFYLLFVLLYFD